ncbi:HPr family phosphocarrier protein [Dactylosporangium sucinum]|uniref:HPr family phosphocarrier protein n=1 Tax=Dactylosporangium sucinum TaxID=1424081 RepID=UPI00167D89A3|nr:HPr family phosphocarrier protein [Dactylosporangium sucinum]
MSASSELPVVLPVDLHARPAAALVRVVAGFSSTVEISQNGKQANARSVLAVIGLGARAGSTVVVRATGDDAEAALNAVASTLENTE